MGYIFSFSGRENGLRTQLMDMPIQQVRFVLKFLILTSKNGRFKE
jgi:hypothetical protein